MRRPPALSIGVAALVAATGLSLVAPAVAGAAPAPPVKFGFVASSYGTYVTAGGLIQSGPSARTALGCVTRPNTTRNNSAVALDLPGVASAAAVDTQVQSVKTSTSSSSTATAETGAVSLLNGLISADAVGAVSTTSFDNSTRSFHTSSDGTSFTNLVIAGQSIPADPAPNTKITLPGIGYVLLNQQVVSKATPGAGITVQAINVVVNQANGVVPSGARLVVMSVKSGLTGPTSSLVGGSAYTSSAAGGSTVTAGTTFPVGLACTGDSDTTKTNSAASLSIPGVLSTGSAVSTARGSSISTAPFAHLTATVQGVNLVSSLIHVDTVKADVTAAGSPATLSDASAFVGLHITGFPGIGDNVAPNTVVNVLPGVTLTLHMQDKRLHSISVVMMQLKITGPNLVGLPNGLVVNIGAASASTA